MKIGLFFGSFNPVHSGHLILAAYMASFTDLNQVWFVVTPQSPFKAQKNLLGEYDRLELVQLATEDDPRFRVTDIEFNLPRPSYTVDTLVYLKEKHPEHEFKLIMGGDALKTLHKWKNYEVLLEEYGIYAYPRPGYESSDMAGHANVKIVDAPRIEISATFIRKAIKSGKPLLYFVPQKVIEIIEKWGHYK